MPHPKKQVHLICEHCETEFSVKASLSKNRRFCSWECRKAHGNSTKDTVRCAQCGKPVQTYKTRPAKYCSIHCWIVARNLSENNPAYHRDISGDKNPMFGRGLHGPDNPMWGRRKESNPAWKGGRKVRKDGYVLVIAPENHPYPISNGKGKTGTKYVLEHRHVMEKHLGRFLEPQEVVHHIDNNPQNNDINNLQLFANQAEHIHIAHSGPVQSG